MGAMPATETLTSGLPTASILPPGMVAAHKPQPPTTEPKPDEPTVVPDIVEPQGEPMIEMLGDIAYEPDQLIYQQEQDAAEQLQQFGIELEEETIESCGTGESEEVDGQTPPIVETDGTVIEPEWHTVGRMPANITHRAGGLRR